MLILDTWIKLLNPYAAIIITNFCCTILIEKDSRKEAPIITRLITAELNSVVIETKVCNIDAGCWIRIMPNNHAGEDGINYYCFHIVLLKSVKIRDSKINKGGHPRDVSTRVYHERPMPAD